MACGSAPRRRDTLAAARVFWADVGDCGQGNGQKIRCSRIQPGWVDPSNAISPANPSVPFCEQANRMQERVFSARRSSALWRSGDGRRAHWQAFKSRWTQWKFIETASDAFQGDRRYRNAIFFAPQNPPVLGTLGVHPPPGTIQKSTS